MRTRRSLMPVLSSETTSLAQSIRLVPMAESPLLLALVEEEGQEIRTPRLAVHHRARTDLVVGVEGAIEAGVEVGSVVHRLPAIWNGDGATDRGVAGTGVDIGDEAVDDLTRMEVSSAIGDFPRLRT